MDQFNNEKPPIKRVEAKKDESEFVADSKGYFLIEINMGEGIIYAHHYTNDKKYTCSLVGKTTEQLYYTMIREGLVGSLIHAAYLGAELQKAEIALKYDLNNYIQDEPFELSKVGEMIGDDDAAFDEDEE